MPIKSFKILLIISVVLGMAFFLNPAQAIYNESECTAIGGTCQDAMAEPCLGPVLEYKTGYCPTQPSHIQCCAPRNIPLGGDVGVTPDGDGTISLPNPLGVQSFAELIDRIVSYLMWIGAPIVTLMIIIGAFQILTAAGSPEKITKARKTITYAVIGYALILLSRGITLIIANILGYQ